MCIGKDLNYFILWVCNVFFICIKVDFLVFEFNCIFLFVRESGILKINIV